MSFVTPAKRVVAGAACHSVIGGLISSGYADRIRAHGIVVDTSHPLIGPKVKAMLFWGLYERSEALLIKRHLRRDLDVVELGSSLGVISCLIRRYLRPDCKLICVEAHGELTQVAVRNLLLNSLSANTKVINGAVNYDGSTLRLVSAEDTLGTTVTAQEDGDPGVPSTTLSGVLEEAGIDSFSLVSDIEGAEAAMLFRDPVALEKCQQIVIELHDTEFEGSRITTAAMRDFLITKHAFRLTAQRGEVYVFDR